MINKFLKITTEMCCNKIIILHDGPFTDIHSIKM